MCASRVADELPGQNALLSVKRLHTFASEALVHVAATHCRTIVLHCVVWRVPPLLVWCAGPTRPVPETAHVINSNPLGQKIVTIPEAVHYGVVRVRRERGQMPPPVLAVRLGVTPAERQLKRAPTDAPGLGVARGSTRGRWRRVVAAQQQAVQVVRHHHHLFTFQVPVPDHDLHYGPPRPLAGVLSPVDGQLPGPAPCVRALPLRPHSVHQKRFVGAIVLSAHYKPLRLWHGSWQIRPHLNRVVVRRPALPHHVAMRPVAVCSIQHPPWKLGVKRTVGVSGH
mmetsp:Transcript_14989/g.30092  ORF Transcript_14989/g.30092 Transcript_14989/m.30092 type:complete len:282 (+) Transcript_14989:2890-3735(+)